MKQMRVRVGRNNHSGKLARSVHDLFVVLVFFCLTALLTWPYINYLRDVVADPGDPYLVSWILWWDYHQTFTNPLHLFDANIFYPLRYTLAFSEHCYGLALPFFPLFALGLRPLTVHAIAMFLGFVFSGYGAFRLGRTLTGSTSVGWVTGIVFAFVPFRFHLLSHLPYLFSLWIPLLFEALVLFLRGRTRKQAIWLGFVFFMNGLTSVSLFSLLLVPFAFSAAVLLTRHQLWRDRECWRRGAVALGIAALALVPFMLPYYLVSKLYGFKRSIAEVKANSAWPIHWLSVENRNKLWFRMGEGTPGALQFKLFPGLLPILFSMAAVILSGPVKNAVAVQQRSVNGQWLRRLDVVVAGAFVLSIPAIGFDGTNAFGNIFHYVTSERVLAVLTVAIIARLCIRYPASLRTVNANLIETLRSDHRSDAFWLGIILTVTGFCYSLGWNFFFYRICYDLLPTFRSMRVPTRGAMFAYLGLSVLAGLGVQRLAELVRVRRPRIRSAAVFTVACALLLCELNGAPLAVMRGDVFPDAVTLRLKQTPMRGGLVVLPAGPDFNHHHILRSADHQKPLIVGTSGFNSPYEDQIEAATRAGAIANEFMDLLERIPTSYVVIENQLIAPERRVDYESFLTRALTAGRLRYVNRFDDRDDLYAVVKTEPQARMERPLPFALENKDWSELLNDDPVNLVGNYGKWSQKLYRFYLVSFGTLPRYADFLPDVKTLGRRVIRNTPPEQTQLEHNLNELSVDWVERAKFRNLYNTMTNDRYVDTLVSNAGIGLAPAERADLIEKLNGGGLTRAQALIAIVDHPKLVKKEESRSQVLLHYFGYLRRNPDDPPDNSLDGFNFWVRKLETSGDSGRLPSAFTESFERERIEKK
jgi:hypothetical protein